jgi:hypothetical protein
MRLIMFIAKMSPYNIGETAGFEDARAAEIVSRGAAVYADAAVVETVEAVIDNTPVDRMLRRGRR